MILDLGNLIKRGIDNYSGAWYKGLRVLWTTSFSNFFLYFNLKKDQIMLAIFGFHSENIFWRKIYTYLYKKLQFRTILLPYKKCFTKENI